MALSPEYGWPEPDNSSLVKNGAQDIRALGDAIDTSVWNIGYGQAGKNKIINGDFSIWQRGTSTSVANDATGIFVSDRFKWRSNGTSVTRTASQQTFTPGTAPVAGYEGQYFLRLATTVAGSGSTINWLLQNLEDVRTFAGQTVTVSFWAKVDTSTRSIDISFVQEFGSGGSSAVSITAQTITATTSWVRYSKTFSIPSIASKTVGTSSFLQLRISMPVNTVMDLDLWGVQVEAGSVATAFQTATGTIQGELAACQRYYQKFLNTGGNAVLAHTGINISTTRSFHYVALPVNFRTTPSVAESGAVVGDGANANQDITAISVYAVASNSVSLDCTHNTGYVASDSLFLILPNNAYFEMSAEL
jgi:hypothetical protein